MNDEKNTELYSDYAEEFSDFYERQARRYEGGSDGKEERE